MTFLSAVFKNAFSFTVMALTLAGMGCAPAPQSANPPAAGPASPVLPPGPPPDPHAPGMVWRVSGGKTSFFLAGSFHLLRASDYPLPEAYETAWRESAHLVFEIPPGDASSPGTQAAMKPLVTLPSGTLEDRLSPPAWQELTAWSTRTGTPLEALKTQPPWMAALTLTLSATQRLGFRGDQGLEHHFTARLPGSGKTSEGLESVIGQLSLFDRLPSATQEAMLRQALSDTATLSEKAASLAQSWRNGDAAALHHTFAESFRDFPEVKKLLLDDRNAAWIPRLEALLQGDRSTMVLVGAGHLCGPGSVIDLLESKGYRCIHIKSAPPSTVPSVQPLPVAEPVPVKKAA